MTTKLIIALCSLLLNLDAQAGVAKPFTISGTISGRDHGYIYLRYTLPNGNPVKDSALITAGKFNFKGQIASPQLAYLFGTSAIPSMEDPNFVPVFIEPVAMKLLVQQDQFKYAKLTGSKSQDEYTLLLQQKEQVQKKWGVVMDTLNKVSKRNRLEYQALRSWVLTPYNADITAIEDGFMREHPSSYVSAYLLYFNPRINDDTAKKIYSKFAQHVKATGFGAMLADRWAKQTLGLPGNKAANFSAKDINGQTLNLADYKGKYVLLDFWASWCVPCRRSNPHLLELYTRYKEKGFEIIGISDDDSKPDAWRTAVQKDGIGVWKHILRGLDPERMKQGDAINHPNEISNSKYGVVSLPTKILIDREGNIIARTGGDEEGMIDQKLAEIFK